MYPNTLKNNIALVGNSEVRWAEKIKIKDKWKNSINRQRSYNFIYEAMSFLLVHCYQCLSYILIVTHIMKRPTEESLQQPPWPWQLCLSPQVASGSATNNDVQSQSLSAQSPAPGSCSIFMKTDWQLQSAEQWLANISCQTS